jgi:hypothetical protein
LQIITLKLQSEDIEPQALRDIIQEILEEALPYETDGAVESVEAICDEYTTSIGTA